MDRSTVTVSTLTYIAFHLNSVVDADKHRDISVAEAKALIKDGTAFERMVKPCLIEEEFPAWRITPENEAEIPSDWRLMAEGSDESVMMGVENNGFCLLIGYLLDGIQYRAEH